MDLTTGDLKSTGQLNWGGITTVHGEGVYGIDADTKNIL